MNKEDIVNKLVKNGTLSKINKRFYINFDSFQPFRVDEYKVKNVGKETILILICNQKIFEYWISQDMLIPPWQTNWFQLKESFLVKVNDSKLKYILKEAIKKAGNINSLSKIIGMTGTSIYQLNSKKKKMISVRKLRLLLNFLGICYSRINKNIEYTKKGTLISIKNPKFPIDLNSKYGALILGHVVSDGCLYIDKKARNVIRTKYSINDEEYIEVFIGYIKNVFGEVHVQTEFIRNCTTLRIGSSIIGECLKKVGAIVGNKAKLNKGVPWIIRLGSDKLKVYYLRAVFNDEGSLYIGKESYKSYIILSRYMHINIEKSQVDKLNKLDSMVTRRFPTGHVSRSITIKKVKEAIDDKDIEKIICSVPKMLLEEASILKEFGIENRIWNRSLNITHLGNYSVCCDIFINKRKSIEKFNEYVGFLSEYKQEKLKKIINNRC